MNTKWDADGYSSILDKAQKSESAYREAYVRANQKDVENFISAVKKYGVSTSCVETYRKQITAGYRNIQNLVENMQAHQAEYTAMLRQGKKQIDNQSMNVHTYGWISAATVISYNDSLSVAFAKSQKSFSSDFNDISAFMQTKEFQSASNKAMASKMSDLTLLLDTLVPQMGLNAVQDYTDSLLESAMTSILDSLSETSANVTWDGTLDYLGSKLGIDNLDDWVSELKSALKVYGSSWKNFVTSDAYEQLLSEIEDEDMRKCFGEVLEELFTNPTAKEAYLLGEKIGDVTDALELGDMCVDMALRVMNDYSAQVGYLDAMEEGLLQAGLGNAKVLTLIDEMRQNYSDSFSYALDETYDYLWGEIKKSSFSAVIKQADSLVPGLNYANLALKVASGGAKIVSGDEISAYGGLAGLYQYDQCLTTAYESYTRMISDGVATAQDVEQADKLFELLRATKIKEYNYMIDLSTDKAQIQLYQNKISELKHIGAKRTDESGASGANQSDKAKASGRF